MGPGTQGQKEIAKRLTTPSPTARSRLLREPGGASQIWGWLSWALAWGSGGENPLVIPRLIPEIDFKGTRQFGLIERRIFVCSLMIFWAQKETDISGGLQACPPPVIAQGDFKGLMSGYWAWIRSRGVSGLALGK